MKNVFDLEQIAHKFKQAFTESFAQLGIDLEVERSAQPLPVEGDSLSAFRCLLNLAMNAKEAVLLAAHDHGRIMIKTWRENDRAMLSVSDNGTGCAGPLPFTNRWSPPPTQSSGRGHGLLIISRTIKELGGSIQCVSYTGKGTLFTITLPLMQRTTATPSPDDLLIIGIEDGGL